ncbi:PIG-P-domain-containing protein [Pleurostoma richardsiae]|uniref:PIG-P-domain-containing protein n=1 Tax=Pleurostoma richardsiae TaxID=41990 RepID=A0AA38RPD2_9PEZI|nr:PIG-P-domain-containing protein [Pleurostoma richardsiae]
MSISSEEEEDDRLLLSDNQSNDESDASSGDDAAPPRPPVPQHNFAPPFYGRPPTPLPPSPSLTSLLRPSRPTTPDASDDELEPVPRASPKVPTYEYYGFVLYLFSSLAFLIYLLWSYLPSPFLHALGIYYYPNRWWSLAIPSFLVMLIVYIYVALAAYNTEIMTLPLSSIETVVDEVAQIAVVDSKGRIRNYAVSKRRENGGPGGPGGHGGRGRDRRGGGEAVGAKVRADGELDWKNIWNEGTDAVMDVPLAGVCEVLYGDVKGEDMDGAEGDVLW